jgi:hypothetical protein
MDGSIARPHDRADHTRIIIDAQVAWSLPRRGVADAMQVDRE